MIPNETQFLMNAQEYDPAGSFDPLPEGMYMAWVKTAELKPTKDGTGLMVVCQFEVIEAEHKGRVFFDRFNYKNNSQQAQEIGRKQLSALQYSTGVLRLTDPKQLIGIPIMVRLGIRAAEGQYQAQNVVREYRTQAGVKPQDLHSGRAQGVPTGAPSAMPIMAPAPQAQPYAQPAPQYQQPMYPATAQAPAGYVPQATQPYPAQAEAPTYSVPQTPQQVQAPAFTPPAYTPQPPAQEMQAVPTFTPPAAPAFTPPAGAKLAFTPPAGVPPAMAPKK